MMEFLATKQGEGGGGIKNTAKSADRREAYGLCIDLVTILITILLACMSHHGLTHGTPYLGRGGGGGGRER